MLLYCCLYAIERFERFIDLKAVITSFGSSGDFNPCLGIARSLKNKGHHVIFLSNPFYKKQIVDAGIDYIPAGEHIDIFKEIKDNPQYLNQHTGPRAVWKMVLQVVPVMYDSMNRLIEEHSPDFLVTHMLEYGSVIAAIDHSLPYATIAPNPTAWFPIHDPAHFAFHPMPLFMRSFAARCVRSMTNVAFKHHLTPLCKKQNIPQHIQSLDDMFDKSYLNLGLWSPVFKNANPDDPSHSKICGFVRDDNIKHWPDIPPDIERLLNADIKPVVVGLGSTAAIHGGNIYRSAALACKRLNLPCLLIGPDTQQFSDSANNILSIDFAPFGAVFPHASIIINHGGVNTTAESMRAGVPFIVVPHAYDQFDNAIRAEQMGISHKIRVSKVTADAFTELFTQIKSDTNMRDKVKQVSRLMLAEPDAADTASNALIDSLPNQQPSS